ncbi:DUF3347 domain-containing protein [Pedobacter immunditicola]|uniref:DUF3347 domain-containing protein n=1 Tax=Pedobacter immunditicola TaxID=3133440 RepID=UPI0030A9EB27
MKKIFLFLAFMSTTFVQKSYSQETTTQAQTQLSQLLDSYYDIKDALVAGDASKAALNAGQFVKAANAIDYKVIAEGNIHALLKDAGTISDTQDIKKQREQFVNLSANMIAVAKGTKLGAQPIYEAYCPMKKASWLSNNKTIRNPYYGSAMLSCGKVVETLNQ